MSEKAELVAAAQINVVAGPPANIAFLSNNGFKSVSRTSAGVYEMELDHEHDINKRLIDVTRNNTVIGQISASSLDKRNIQIICSNAVGAATDSPFFVKVYQVNNSKC